MKVAMARARLIMVAALVATCSAVQPPVDRGEQIAAIRRLEAQTGIMAPAAAKELKGMAAPGEALKALQPPVDRNEQVAAIRRLEAQTGVMAPAAAKEITGGARAEWGSTMSRGKGWNREAFEDVVVPKRFQNVGNDTRDRPSVRDLRSALSKSGGLPSNKTRANNKVTSKTIWIFWAQGEAHLAAQKQGKYGNCLVTCVQKWRDLNPKWTVELVDDARAKELSVSYARFFNKGAIGQALLSDVLRLDLLNRYGGVWADVSVCPVAPLDDYIEEKLAPAGFYSLWLNHWPTDNDALTCETQCYNADAEQCNARVTVTWFMAASGPKNYVIHAWHKELSDRMARIEKGSNDYPYFLVHCVFTDLVVHGGKDLEHLTKKLQKMPKDLPAGDAGWAELLKLNPNDPNRMVDKYHEGCPAPSTVQRAETIEKREMERVARDEAAAAADAAATSPEEAAAAEATAADADVAAAVAAAVAVADEVAAANAAADAPVAPDACHRCGEGENCCGAGGSWEGLCPGERSWEDGHTACFKDMETKGIAVPGMKAALEKAKATPS
jgi:hypothetical protein